jgi:hypothetical protein
VPDIYVGSHNCVELLNVGHTFFSIDILSNEYEAAHERFGGLLFVGVLLIVNYNLQIQIFVTQMN